MNDWEISSLYKGALNLHNPYVIFCNWGNLRQKKEK